MNRVRALVIKSSRKIKRPLNDATRWWRARSTTPTVALGTVRRRIELVLSALYGLHFEISAASSEVNRSALRLRDVSVVARHDGMTIELPATMDATNGVDAAIARYRLLAIEQAARSVRNSAAFAPANDDPVARDLYNLRESAEIDASIVQASPGVATLLREERVRTLAERGSIGKLSASERAVEDIVHAVLRSAPSEIPNEIHAGSSPEESLAWARETAGRITELGGGYRSRALASIWGEPLASNAAVRSEFDNHLNEMMPQNPGYGSGTANVPSADADADLQELTPGGANAAKSSDEITEDDERDDATAPSDTAVGTRAPLTPDGSVAAPANGSGPLSSLDTEITIASRSGAGILYHEWDCNASSYRELGAIVRAYPAAEGDAAWADRILGEHPALVRRVRREFERLRARRARMLRQREGDELDLAACVRALADSTAGDSSDDRLYMAVRSARRALAITVLVDVSGSTRDTVSDGQRVIDIEKTTLLLASEAFDALGDSYSILTFAGTGATDVRIAPLKTFAEPNGEAVRRRISGIEAGGNTRLGAAIRHATAVLSAQPAGHRLLLILSDGKPNDVDRYFTTYAIEDSRQAVFEARSNGIYPFCLTIDANEPDAYLARVFGASGHTILRDPAQLPSALLDLVRQLLRGSGT